MEKPSKTFQKHLDAVQSGKVSKSNIVGIRKLLNGANRRANGWTVGATTPLGTLEQANEICEALATNYAICQGDLHLGGIAVLQNKRNKKKLETVADIIADIDHFRLLGFESIMPDGCHTVPVYRVIAKNGKSFDFRNVPWQSGGDGPEILYDWN